MIRRTAGKLNPVKKRRERGRERESKISDRFYKCIMKRTRKMRGALDVSEKKNTIGVHRQGDYRWSRKCENIGRSQLFR